MGPNELVFLFGTAVSAGLLMTSHLPFWMGLVVSLSGFSVLWIASLIVRDAGIVDVFWGPCLTLLGWFYVVFAMPEAGWRGVLAASLVSPALLTYLLLKISGVAMLDRGMVTRNPEYADYMESTSAFVPVPRRWRDIRNLAGG